MSEMLGVTSGGSETKPVVIENTFEEVKINYKNLGCSENLANFLALCENYEGRAYAKITEGLKINMLMAYMAEELDLVSPKGLDYAYSAGVLTKAEAEYAKELFENLPEPGDGPGDTIAV